MTDRQDVTIAAASAALPAPAAPGLLGFIVQCEVCTQKALVDRQGSWVCPMCAEVAEPHPCREGHVGVLRWGICDACGQDASDPVTGTFLAPGNTGLPDDDDYPIGGATA